MRGVRERKYLLLLAALLVAAVMEPLVADWSEHTRIIAAVTVSIVNLSVLLVVFGQRWQRWLAVFLLAPALASNIVHEALSNWTEIAAIVYHCFAFVFLGFAVAVILTRIFRQETIQTDAVIGAICGYLLAAVTWANAYALIYLLRPGSFRVTDVIAERIGEWHLRRFFFGYFSVTTLTSLGYGDITPIGTLVLSLSWIEVVFGQFYIAVVVAQLVGLRLAQSIRRERPDSE
jgi:voltage-gated potassium channel